MENLKLSQNQGVLTVALNRPEKRNAFFPEMIRDITRTFVKAGKDKALRAILLTGEGKSFCSGGDLEWMKSMASYTLKKNVQDAEELFGMYWAIRTAPVPVIGKVFGHCFGGGAGLTAVCDIVAAESSTLFSFSEVKWGLLPAVISPFVTERVSPAKIAEWFYTAKVFSAAEALSGGLVNFTGGGPEADAYLTDTLNQILNSAPEAVRASKKLQQSYSRVAWGKVRPQVTKLIAARRVSAEGQKGLQAFLDKKNPPWTESPNGAPYATPAKN